MTDNMEMLIQLIKKNVDVQYDEKLPTEDQIYVISDTMRNSLNGVYPITDTEYEIVKKRLPEQIIHSIGYSDTLRLRDSEHMHWYKSRMHDEYFWKRYKSFLGDKWSMPVVSKLNINTDNIMDDLGDPQSDNPFQRRGLLLGDVQSGKTATYTAICNKAADAGYRVIIVLAGMMENLRIQTQERLDAEFVGLDSKYSLDKKADSSMKNIPVGVGKIPPYKKEKCITRFTSVMTDFKASTLKSVGLNLATLDGTALFVVKKNKSILNNLQKWLTKDEDVLNLPLLLIDDEADNASVNTKKINGRENDEYERTAINNGINKILRSFKQATYLGVTATPFANIFIDPDIDLDGAAIDLFPRHFLTLLPTPDNYIGADKIFGNENSDNDGKGIEGKYGNSLIPINNEEQEEYYVFKHKKELADELIDLPKSLEEAIRYFVLITAITDYRLDINKHRTMMVNVSRFTDVQIKTANLIEEYINQMKSDVDNYAMLPNEKTMEINNLCKLKETWDRFNLDIIGELKWEELLKEYLNNAIRRIEVRPVNQRTGASSLDYYNYKNGMRVIAIGGNSLSRGLTLEGLCVSYFYRNTMMYDTLLQMGRWFGYRANYDDMFKIWMGEDAIDWYGYITDAFNELKNELRQMALQNQTPEEFGLKVRQDPGSLIVTARNKMRSGTKVSVPVTLSGRMIETPRLWNDSEIIKANNRLCVEFLNSIDAMDEVIAEYSYDSGKKYHIWRDVPSTAISELVKTYNCHPWNLNFQPIGLADYIEADEENRLWDVAIPFGNSQEEYKTTINGKIVTIYGECRKVKVDPSIKNMLRVNERHVRIGAGGCSKIGLDENKIDELKKENHVKATDKTYLIEGRKPIALLHVMDVSALKLVRFPEHIFAIGLGFPKGKEERKANYVVNATELQSYIDTSDVEDEDDELQ